MQQKSSALIGEGFRALDVSKRSSRSEVTAINSYSWSRREGGQQQQEDDDDEEEEKVIENMETYSLSHFHIDSNVQS